MQRVRFQYDLKLSASRGKSCDVSKKSFNKGSEILVVTL